MTTILPTVVGMAALCCGMLCAAEKPPADRVRPENPGAASDSADPATVSTPSKTPATVVPAQAPDAASDGMTITFAGETYELRENKNAPGQVNSELREYLRKGEDWEGYRKLVALRMQNVKTDAAGLARSTLEQVRKRHPDSYVKELKMEQDTATILFILVVGDDAEMNLFRYQRAGSGIASAQFVLRNKPPYDTQKKFKAEQDREWEAWLEGLTTLGTQASALMAATAGKGVVEPAKVANSDDAIPRPAKP